MSDEHRTLKSKSKKKETKPAMSIDEVLGTGLEGKSQAPITPLPEKGTTSTLLILSTAHNGQQSQILVFSNSEAAATVERRLKLRNAKLVTDIIEVDGYVYV